MGLSICFLIGFLYSFKLLIKSLIFKPVVKYMITQRILKLHQASQKLSSYFVDFEQTKIYSYLSILSFYEHIFIYTYLC